MTHPEAALHRAVARYLDLALPAHVVWTTLGHGGGGKVRGAVLKGMGLHAGWPDIILTWWEEVERLWPIPCNRGLNGIGIELKSARGVVSRDQKVLHGRLRKAGWHIYVCRDIGEVAAALAKHLTIRARVA